MGQVSSLEGKRFGRLLVLSRYGSERNKGYTRALWLCRCDCGSEVIADTHVLTSGHKQSCGCLHDDVRRRPKEPWLGKFHGHIEDIRRKWEILHVTWNGMKSRCYNKNSKEYHRYGGRGIKMCEEWRERSESFILWALKNGFKPGLTIDRIDNDRDYEPGNCQFLTRGENSAKSRSKMITICGVTLSQSGWSAIAYNGRPGVFSRDKIKYGYDFAISKLTDALIHFDYAHSNNDIRTEH